MAMVTAADPAPHRSALRTIWIVSEGSPGHISQSRGLVEAIGSLVPAQSFQVEVREKGGGGLRGLYRALFQLTPGLRPLWIRFCASCGDLPLTPPEMIVASGGKSVFSARFLADRYDVPLVYCGSPAPYPAAWFDCILSTGNSADKGKNWIPTDVLLNPITPAMVNQAAAAFALPAGNSSSPAARIGTVLVGGRSRSQLFADEDWLDLGRQLNLLAQRDGWSWLIATSRRTGAEAEAILRATLDPAYILDAVWWSENPRKVVRAYLGHAQAVFVGCDSMTMVSEAVCSGRPVVVFGPRESQPSMMIDGFLANLEKKKLLLARTCQNLGKSAVELARLAPMSESPIMGYAQNVLQILAGKFRPGQGFDNGGGL